MKFKFDSLAMACVALFAFSAICGSALYRHRAEQQLSKRTDSVPAIVEKLIDNYMEQVVTAEVVGPFPFEEYIHGAEVQFDNFHDGMTAETEAFYNAILVGSGGATTAKCIPVTNNFCIVMLYDAEGNFVPCPVGLWFKTRGEEITSYRICKLQPFSTLDAEYSEDIG